MAVKVTPVEAHTVLPGFAAMLIVGATNGFTVMVMVLLVAVAALVQAALEVITQVI